MPAPAAVLAVLASGNRGGARYGGEGHPGRDRGYIGVGRRGGAR